MQGFTKVKKPEYALKNFSLITILKDVVIYELELMFELYEIMSTNA